LAGPLSEISGTKTLRLSDVREKALALARDKNNKEKENRAASEFPSSSVSLSDEFSPNGEFIVLAANKNVRELREPFVTPVDFLTELMRVPGGCRGMMILERLGLEREVILSKLKEEVNSRPLECPYCQHPMKNWPKEWFSDTIAGWYGPVLSQDAQRVLNFAHQEAKHAAKSRIGSEHILL
jgi:hypothetical protein